MFYTARMGNVVLLLVNLWLLVEVAPLEARGGYSSLVLGIVTVYRHSVASIGIVTVYRQLVSSVGIVNLYLLADVVRWISPSR